MKKREMEYEDYISELEKVVEKLESGNIKLEESLDSFQDGIEIYRKCKDILKTAEGKISVIEDEEEKDLIIEDIED